MSNPSPTRTHIGYNWVEVILLNTMTEVPDAQAPSREEQLLSTEANPDNQVQQESVAAPQAVVQEPLEVQPEEVEYEEGSVYNFVDPQGQGYSIVIQRVADDKLTILNQTAPGTEPAEISLEDAKNMFVNGKLVQ